MNTKIISSNKNHIYLVDWARTFAIQKKSLSIEPSVGNIKTLYDSELKNYFGLCALARSKSADHELREIANLKLFKTRVALEKSIFYTVDSYACSLEGKINCILANNFYGNSKKQGVSLRLPLQSCEPTKLCGNACYAHDVLDATPFAVIRGSINGWRADYFEKGNKKERVYILQCLKPHTLRAIKNANNELRQLPEDFSRRPYIRFSHVGEIVFYPNFANSLAEQLMKESNSKIDAIVYTRHSKAKELDPNLWVINYTLDAVSMDRRKYAPQEARIVFSAFGGSIRDDVSVNFLEHHRHEHYKPVGSGNICPATKPDTLDRTCDACKCNKCFVKPLD